MLPFRLDLRVEGDLPGGGAHYVGDRPCAALALRPDDSQLTRIDMVAHIGGIEGFGKASVLQHGFQLIVDLYGGVVQFFRALNGDAAHLVGGRHPPALKPVDIGLEPGPGGHVQIAALGGGGLQRVRRRIALPQYGQCHRAGGDEGQ